MLALRRTTRPDERAWTQAHQTKLRLLNYATSKQSHYLVANLIIMFKANPKPGETIRWDADFFLMLFFRGR
jgi:hypothetical protein